MAKHGYESHEECQREIDNAPDAYTAEHRFQIFTNMEEVVRHENELKGRTHTPHKYRRRIPRRPKARSV